MARTFENLQAVRGVACLLVVLIHIGNWDTKFVGGTPGFSLVRWVGDWGVDLFFAISGFILASSCLGSFGSPGKVPGFLLRRCWRIYPPYFAALGISALVGGLYFNWPILSAEWAPAWPRWVLLLPCELPNLVMGQAWTLTYEVMFYAVLGLTLALPGRLAAGILTGWAAAVVAATVTGWPGGDWGKFAFSPFVLEFLGGCAAAWLDAKGIGPRPKFALLAAGGYWLLAFAAMLATGGGHEAVWTWTPGRVLVWGFPAVAVVYSAAALPALRCLPRWLHRTGDASYSLYLTHTMVLYGAFVVGTWMPHSKVPHVSWMIGTLLACLGVGFAFHRWVERPLLNLAKRPRRLDTSAPPVIPTGDTEGTADGRLASVRPPAAAKQGSRNGRPGQRLPR